MIRLAIVSPCYNEEEMLRVSAQRLLELLDSMVKDGKVSPDSFVLYVNDGSKDATWSIINELNAADKRICGISLAHNVGHQNAILAGMMTARTMVDGVVTIDADLQDDIRCIPQMVDLYEQGNEIVYGVKVSREADPALKRITAEAFYKLQESMGVQTIYNHADFRFMGKRALDGLSLFEERNIYLRGLIPLIGYKSATVDDVISDREHGQSKYTLRKMLNLAFDGITSFSIRPIQVITITGTVMLILAFAMLIYVIVSRLMGHYVPGWSSLMLSVWFIGSVLTISIGIVGTYIGKMYMEMKRRPRYIIDQSLLPK
ncbi:MAG: glycosyltransferase family 2 protein [Bacteroidaceae bacterium]|nr:glycosyltransferase family 2 protein [Bacteroidaceae bacterium]